MKSELFRKCQVKSRVKRPEVKKKKLLNAKKIANEINQSISINDQ